MNTDSVRHPGLNLGSHHGEAHDQAETLVFGFWVFMMSDLIIFGLMFALFLTAQNPMGYAGGPGAADIVNITSAFAQTLLLLTSSLTFGFAGLALRHKTAVSWVYFWLSVTLILGIGFLTLELHDFRELFAMGALPSRSAFLSAYYGLVPLHGLHVTAGCIWILIMLVQIRVLGIHRPAVKVRLLRLGLFWHFLDIIWIGIFSIVFLGGLA